jgi:hypothetical protein
VTAASGEFSPLRFDPRRVGGLKPVGDYVSGRVECQERSYDVVMEPDFLLEDQGDGWWHCSSPLTCFILDGPASVPDAGGEFWLVRTKPSIQWDGEPKYEARSGPDHPLAKPLHATNLALVMAASRYGRTDLNGDWSIPVYPVAGDARTVHDSEWIGGLAVKANVTRPN